MFCCGHFNLSTRPLLGKVALQRKAGDKRFDWLMSNIQTLDVTLIGQYTMQQNVKLTKVKVFRSVVNSFLSLYYLACYFIVGLRELVSKRSSLCWRSSPSSFSFILTSAVFYRFPFGVSSVARSLASNKNWTPRTGCRRTSWPEAFEIFRFVECPTTRQCLPQIRQHSVAIHYFPCAFFSQQTFCHLHLNDNNSQLKQ